VVSVTPPLPQPPADRTRPAVLIFANCQGEDIRNVMASVEPLREAYEFKLIAYHVLNQPWGGWENYGPGFMSNVETLWYQEGPDFPQERARLHEALPADIRTIRFPSPSMLSLWPLAGGDQRREPEELYPDGRYPRVDYVAAQLAADLAGQDLSDDSIFDRYMEMSAQRLPNLDRRLAIDIARWQQRDAIVDIPVGEYLHDSFREVPLFHTWTHLTAEPVRFLAKRLCETTFADTADLEQLASAIDALLAFHTGQDFEQTPVHPLVAQHFGLAWYRPDALYRFHSHEWTFRDYIVHLIRHAPYCRESDIGVAETALATQAGELGDEL